MSAGRPTRLDYTREQMFELEKIDRDNNSKFVREFMKYVIDDFDTMLLVVALTGTGVALIAKQYEDWATKTESDWFSWDKLTDDEKQTTPQPPPVNPMNYVLGFLAGGVAGVALADLVTNPQFKNLKGGNAWDFSSSVLQAAENVSMLAWGLLFVRGIFGTGGMGSVLEKIPLAGGSS